MIPVQIMTYQKTINGPVNVTKIDIIEEMVTLTGFFLHGVLFCEQILRQEVSGKIFIRSIYYEII